MKHPNKKACSVEGRSGLGHRHITTTEIYARVSNHALRRAVRIVS